MDFNQYFSFEQFKNLYTLRIDKTESGSPNPEFYKQLPTFSIAMTNFIKTLSEEKGLMPIQYSEGHSSYTQYRWNKLLNKEKIDDSQEELLGTIFRMSLVQALPRSAVNKIKLLKAYTGLVQKVNEGNFDFHDLSSSEQCGICAQDLQLEFKNWKPSFISYNKELQDFVPPKSCLINEIKELDITFKTGILLVADWFRISEFTAAVNYTETSINFSAGREASTRFALENFNVIHIHVGNNSPSILQKGDNLIIGRDDEEKSIKYENVGHVCTDMWNVTIVEKEQLINIVAKTTGLEKAHSIVETYLQENDYDEIEVVPGDYKLRYHPDYEHFKKMEKDKSIPKSVDAFFTLKKVIVEKTKKLKM